jgi:SpoVK/Ycf46/Vps4 family AAA+-type ATPase
MIGHDPSKEGDWYEGDYVVLQLLKLLAEHVQAVTWERQGAAGVGIDCWLTEGRRSVAVQCKRSGDRNWTLRRLDQEAVLSAARDKLLNHDADDFRFVTDAPSADLRKLIDAAHAHEGPAGWWDDSKPSARETLMEALGFSDDSPGDIAAAHQVVSSCRLQVVGAPWIREQLDEKARDLAESNHLALRQALFDLVRANLTRTIGIAEARSWVEAAGIALSPRPHEARVHDQLAVLAHEFVSAAEGRRRGMAAIERPETAQLLKGLEELPPRRVVVVHGPAGTGKSEVLAAAVAHLQAQLAPVLVLRPDLTNELVGLQNDPIATFALYAGEKRGVVVIDQLDQAFDSGTSSVEAQRRCRRWLQRARDRRLTVVVGCRTVDATKNTQLSHLLHDPGSEGPVGIPVGDLPEAEVIRLLADEEIAFTELEAPVRRLACRALFLRLMLDLHRRGERLTGIRSLVTIAERWWGGLERHVYPGGGQAATKVLDRVVDAMGRDGLWSVAEDQVGSHDTVDALVTAGVLVREQRGGRSRLRPFHQVLGDVRVAQRWATFRDLTELLARIGERSGQSLHHARRLRLAVPLLLERPAGCRLLDDMVRSPQVSPLLKRAVLLAMAELEPVSDDALELLVGWLDQQSLRNHVLATAVAGRPDWLDALSARGWLDESWEQGSPEDRERLLRLLPPVALTWVDGVARHLRQWSRFRPEVLEQAASVFLHEAADDSDELFDLRLEYVVCNAARGDLTDWDQLLGRRPDRALKLVGRLLDDTPSNELCSGNPQWARYFPADIPDASMHIGRRVWDRLRGWWCSLEVPKLEVPSVKWIRISEWAVARVVELMAANLAVALVTGEVILDELLAELPDPQREIDGWLLLRVGAHIPDDPQSREEACRVARALADWFMSDGRWTQLRVGFIYDEANPRPDEEFVARVGELVDNDRLPPLERWIASLRDEWTTNMEKDRWAHGGVGSTLHGLTAWRLLHRLPEARLNREARRLRDELTRKFGLPEDRPSGPVGGIVSSVVPDRIADDWTPEDWIAHLAQANAREGDQRHPPWHPIGEHTVGEYGVRQLAEQLARLAGSDPHRYLEHACAFDDRVVADARDAVLRGVARVRPPDAPTSDPSWAPLDDSTVAQLLEREEYLHHEECSWTIAWTIRERPGYEWSDAVIDRLIDLGGGPQGCVIVADNVSG